MEFSVPQFIEKSPKIIGPFTLKQFMYIGCAGGIILLLYFSIDFVYVILFGGILLAIAFALAFLKINGVPFTTIVKNFLFYSVAPRMYIWKKVELPLFKKTVEQKTIKEAGEQESPVLQMENNGRLKKLRNDLELKI